MRFLRKLFVGALALIGLGTTTLVLLLWGIVSLLASAGEDSGGPSALVHGKLARSIHSGTTAGNSEGVVLDLDLDQPLTESEDQASPLAALTTGHQPLPLRQVVAALRHAATDEKVKGVFATLSGGGHGMAQTQELRDALAVFRQSGKPLVLFTPSLDGSSGATINYYLATAFSDLWLQPSGNLSVSGLAMEVPFGQEALDALGISVELGQRWEFKNAMDGAIRQTMSEAQRQSWQSLLDSWRRQISRGIVERRSLPPEQVDALLDGPPLLAGEARKAGLVDHLGYRDEALAALKSRTGSDELSPFESYARALHQRQPKGQAARIALVEAVGTVSDDKGNGDDMDATTLAKAVHDAVNDAEIKAIVLRIDSPGGSYVASDTLWREVSLAREKGMPVVVSMGDMAASGGYFIAMPASKIVAQPGTITGSVGVFSLKPVLAGTWDKLHVNWETVSTGPYAAMWSSSRPFTPEQRAVFDKSLDAVYQDFTGKLARGRNLSAEAVDKVARGRVWTGEEAQKAGLVDALGGLDKAVEVARELASLPGSQPVSLQRFPQPEPVWEKVLKMLGSGDLQASIHLLARLDSLGSPLLETMASQQSALRSGPALLAPRPLTSGAPGAAGSHQMFSSGI